jgi:maltokinase
VTRDIDPKCLQGLATYIGEARWFGGKGRDLRVSDVLRLPWLPRDPGPTTASDVEPGAESESESGPKAGAGAELPHARVELATVQYTDGLEPAEETYQVPLAYYREPQERLAHALVGTWTDEELGVVYAYDALHDRAATAQWLAGFARGARVDGLVFHRLEGHDLDLDVHSALFSGEQSNSSVRFGEHSLMKVFRKVTTGPNPDIEIHEALTRAHSGHVAELYGWLEYAEQPDGSPQQSMHLAMLSQLLRTASDGWELALASVRDLFAEADLHADEVGGDFAAEAHRLGVATAEVHEALRAEFGVQRWETAELRELSAAMRRRLTDAVAVVPGLAEHHEALDRVFAAVAELDEPVAAQRIHADYHLGQTLREVRGWRIVDFEGEPAKPLADRVRPDSRWRDVGGMLRSFDYAAHAVESDVEDHSPQIEYRAREWSERNQSAFLHGYLGLEEGTTSTPIDELGATDRVLLRAYEADKAVYEAVYEARNRPPWLGIPLRAIAQLAGAEGPGPDPQEADQP